MKRKQPAVPYTIIAVLFAGFWAWIPFNHYFFKTEFWGAGALLRQPQIFQDEKLAGLFFGVTFVTAILCAFSYARGRHNLTLISGFLLWALLLKIISHFWVLANGGETFLLMLIPLLALDRGRGRAGWGALALLSLIFFEAGFSKLQTGFWIQGLAPQWIISNAFEVRSWTEHFLQVRSLEEASLFWQVIGCTVTFGEIGIAVAAIVLLLNLGRTPKIYHYALVVTACFFHLGTALFLDIRELPYIFMLGWVLTLNADDGWFRDLLKWRAPSLELQSSLGVLALMFLAAVFVGARFDLWPRPGALETVGTSLRYNYHWRLFHGDERPVVASVNDLEVNGKGAVLKAFEPKELPPGSLSDLYPSRDLYNYLRLFRLSLKDEKPLRFPESCPSRVRALVSPDEDQVFAKLKLVRWRFRIDRTRLPYRQEVWSGSCRL